MSVFLKARENRSIKKYLKRTLKKLIASSNYVFNLKAMMKFVSPTGSKCSLAELTKISSEHLKRLQSFQQPYYTSLELKYSDTQVPHFKRRLLLVN